MRLNVWNEMQEMKLKNNYNEHDIDEAIDLARTAFRNHFIGFLTTNFNRLSQNANDIYLDVCVMHDIDCVQVRYKRNIRKPFLEKNRFGEFVLLKPDV